MNYVHKLLLVILTSTTFLFLQACGDSAQKAASVKSEPKVVPVPKPKPVFEEVVEAPVEEMIVEIVPNVVKEAVIEEVVEKVLTEEEKWRAGVKTATLYICPPNNYNKSACDVVPVESCLTSSYFLKCTNGFAQKTHPGSRYRDFDWGKDYFEVTYNK